MRRLFVLFALTLAATAAAQGIVPRLLDATGTEDAIVAAGSNSFRTQFIEIDREIPGVEELLRAGILHEERARFALVTPTLVHMVERAGENVMYSTAPWGAPELTTTNSRFTTVGMSVEGTGTFLKPPAPIERPRTTARPHYPTSRPSSSYSSTVGNITCTSTTTPYSSSITCRSNGRIISTTSCTMNQRTYQIDCTSRDYY